MATLIEPRRAARSKLLSGSANTYAIALTGGAFVEPVTSGGAFGLLNLALLVSASVLHGAALYFASKGEVE